MVEKGGRCGIDGPVRYVGCSTHDRCVGVRLLKSERDAPHGGGGTAGDGGGSGNVDGEGEGEWVREVKEVKEAKEVKEKEKSTTTAAAAAAELHQPPCELDLLMARYNMAHTRAERTLFPLAVARDVPIVAFTSTRWNSLQKGHLAWKEAPPTVADCMRFAARETSTLHSHCFIA